MVDDEKNIENLNDKKVIIKSFKKYESSEDGLTKKIDGDLKIEDFHLYESGEENH